jgi:hypothetical protein
MAEELQILAESWSEGTSESDERISSQDNGGCQQPHEESRQKRGVRRCAIEGCSITFSDKGRMLGGVL